MRFSAGEVVCVRGATWVVEQSTTHADCTLLNLSADRRFGTREACTLLLPFDRPVISTQTRRVKSLKPHRWMGHLNAALSEVQSLQHLSGTAGARIDIHPFQLEPALAMIDGSASRFLLADEVGLGKTVQAGLMLAELQRRGWCERALILAPSGLRRQWADELKQRFDISSHVVDAEILSRLTLSLPQDVNPWSVEPVVITSIDYIKQPEVLHGLRGEIWDILIVDEAHRATPESRRYDAVALLANRSRHVVLLSATPHGGDPEAYRALCALGKVDPHDPILLFRRTRQQAGLSRPRRVHLLPVRLTPDEMEMHRLLDSYVGTLWRIGEKSGRRDVQLVATVLRKRAFSSAHSLAASVERRLGALSGSIREPVQSTLLFDSDEDGEDDAPGVYAHVPGALDREEAHLETLLLAARKASVGERKVWALTRLLRRLQEPVIVFTEYRDTLEMLERELRPLRTISTIHGGQNSRDRRDAVHRFISGDANLLLATDAGAEGLNLHSRCRVVINLELPWSPMRLEQRIGRVDRIGQGRAVHATHLYAAGTAENTVLANLVRRLERIDASEIEVAASIINGSPIRAANQDPSPAHTQIVDLKLRAAEEAALANEARGRRQQRSFSKDGIVAVTRVLAARHTPALPSGRAIYIVRVRIGNAAGRLVEDNLVTVSIPISHDDITRGIGARAEELLGCHAPAVVDFAARVGRERAAIIGQESARMVSRVVRREQRIAAIAGGGHGLTQPGLFDNRAQQRRLAHERLRRATLAESGRRIAVIEAAAATTLAQEPRIELMLITC